ncbi:hypothetical protein CBLAS_1340 [Campylobacter blaseri]|uniref:Uncharacterized protein n=1 Tax=Campylobacter blaseri TaxID=2042961 RepID=A0A2P8QZ16_9BACT|nr:hypothetical protein [Campylobacter blaseri]PSM51485.1 hypothetical protein CQ405_07925 [Campylobacter blaseri]PSM52934.1 hypothetical protein CRN67_07930 [Campylobacter blaseri]QKF86507.1 hypothetical protein CBLAS_1340 [Campylobacter blaseri]
MFEEQKTTKNLGDKVKELIEKYQELKEENKNLRNELVSVKTQNEALSNNLGKLEEDIIMKNLTEEELFKEIEDILEK